MGKSHDLATIADDGLDVASLSVGSGGLTVGSGGLTVGTDQLAVDSSGRVTMADQPYFRANYNGSGFNVAASAKFTHNTALYDNCGCFNTSLSRFTAPISGRYIFTFHTIFNPGPNNAFIETRINNTHVKGTRHHFSHNNLGAWNQVSFGQILQLSENDYVEIWNGTTTVNYHGGDWHHWDGQLIG